MTTITLPFKEGIGYICMLTEDDEIILNANENQTFAHIMFWC